MANGRFVEARAALRHYAEFVDHGQIPNYVSDRNSPPEYNSVDASLWEATRRALAAESTRLPVISPREGNRWPDRTASNAARHCCAAGLSSDGREPRRRVDPQPMQHMTVGLVELRVGPRSFGGIWPPASTSMADKARMPGLALRSAAALARA
jgi:hypothetical protein